MKLSFAPFSCKNRSKRTVHSSAVVVSREGNSVGGEDDEGLLHWGKAKRQWEKCEICSHEDYVNSSV